MTDPTAPAAPKKKRRIFLWIFLALQALFLIGLFNAIGSSATSAPADCGTLSTQDCQAAYTLGTGVGFGAYLCIWAVVDLLVGGGYAVYRLAKRP